jgi:hypothetical protein
VLEWTLMPVDTGTALVHLYCEVPAPACRVCWGTACTSGVVGAWTTAVPPLGLPFDTVRVWGATRVTVLQLRPGGQGTVGAVVHP